MEIDDVVKKLKLGKFTTKPVGGKSAIWDHYVRIYDDKDEAINFVECKSCESVHYHDSHSTGTSKLKQHTEKCTQPSRSSSLTNHFKPTGETKLSASEKGDLTALLVGFCTTDMRLFNIVTGDGFKSVIQSAYSLGYKHGANGSIKQNIIEQLPCWTTVSRAVSKQAEGDREKLSSFFERAVIKNFACTLDFWNNDFSSESFITVSLHFIVGQQLFYISLATGSFAEAKTADTVSKFIDNLFAEFKIFRERHNIVFVTDNASKLVRCLSNELHLRCACHCLNLAVSKVLQVPEVSEFVRPAKSIVQHFKRTNMQQSLTKTLKQEVATRWNSVYVHSQFDEIAAILMSRNELSYLFGIHKTDMEALLEFLSEIKKCSEEHSADLVPTLPLVLPWITKLQKISQPSAEDPAVLKQFKEAFSEGLKAKFHITPLHYISSFLHPTLKALTFLNEDDRQWTFQEVRKMLSTLGFVNVADQGQSASDEPKAKKSKLILDIISPPEYHCDEVDNYKSRVVAQLAANNAIKWWHTNREEFPCLWKLAKFVLCIPASEATSERVFSESGRILEERRQRLDSASLDAILFSKHFKSMSLLLWRWFKVFHFSVTCWKCQKP